MTRAAAIALLLLLSAGCQRPPALFVERNARAHLEMLAGTIGSRPAGTPANARARAYIVDQLRLFGYQVRVQEADARRPDLGLTARVSNIIGILPGQQREAVGLLAHYDSRPESPGGGDDGFGVAVTLEAARVIASRSDRQWTTFVLFTDAEETGLMGAAALINDPEVRDDLSAYINVEAAGTSSPSVLFETGPGNSWLLQSWARSAPNPRGGSYAIEIYRRLPNDTDFSILKRHQIPGLNFALIGNSEAYHTSRDSADRIPDRVLRETGENVVAIAIALQARDIRARTQDEATYFDIAGTAAVSYSATASWVISVLALVLGALAWLRVTRLLVTAEGLGRWLLGLGWMLLGSVVTFGAMVLAAWAIRASREVYHPWYAHADRFFLLLAATGGAAAWMMARAGRWIPARAKGLRHPAVAWTYALPAWILLSGVATWAAPAAAYLWTLPLLTAGLVLLLPGMHNSVAARAASVVVLAVAGTLWLRDTVDILRFVVAIFGRLPVITPVYVYPAIIALAGVMIAPPLFAATASARALLRPSIATALLLAAIAVTGVSAWLAPAYTNDRPLRRSVRVLQDAGAGHSLWQLGSLEPGLDLGPNAPDGWALTRAAAPGIPWRPLREPFVFSARLPPLSSAPASIGTYTLAPASSGGGTTLSVSVLPKEPGLTVALILPPAATPARSNLPGIVRSGRWTSAFAAPPAEGIAWQVSFNAITPDRLKDVRVAITAPGVPGSADWPRLAPWMPQERIAWSAATTWVLDPAATPPLEPVAPLR